MHHDLRNLDRIVRDRLDQSGWLVVHVGSETEWWAAVHWTIRSVRQGPGCEVVVPFMVDPMYAGNRRTSAVWAMLASTVRPESRLDMTTAISEVSLQRGRLAESIETLLDALDRYRNHVQLHEGAATLPERGA